MNTKTRTLLLSIFALSLVVSSVAYAQYFNYERLLGKSNPYVSEIKGDSIFLYERADSSLSLVDKIETQTKILQDIRVINRNQAKVETWLASSVVLNIFCLILILYFFLRKRV